MAGIFWVGTKIVFIVSSPSLKMNDSPRQPKRPLQAKPSRQDRQDKSPAARYFPPIKWGLRPARLSGKADYLLRPSPLISAANDQLSCSEMTCYRGLSELC